MGVVGLLPGGKTASIGAKLAKSAKVLTRGLVAFGMYDGARLLNDVVKRGNKYAGTGNDGLRAERFSDR